MLEVPTEESISPGGRCPCTQASRYCFDTWGAAVQVLGGGGRVASRCSFSGEYFDLGRRLFHYHLERRPVRHQPPDSRSPAPPPPSGLDVTLQELVPPQSTAPAGDFHPPLADSRSNSKKANPGSPGATSHQHDEQKPCMATTLRGGRAPVGRLSTASCALDKLQRSTQRLEPTSASRG